MAFELPAASLTVTVTVFVPVCSGIVATFQVTALRVPDMVATPLPPRR